MALNLWINALTLSSSSKHFQKPYVLRLDFVSQAFDKLPSFDDFLKLLLLPVKKNQKRHAFFFFFCLTVLFIFSVDSEFF